MGKQFCWLKLPDPDAFGRSVDKKVMKVVDGSNIGDALHQRHRLQFRRLAVQNGRIDDICQIASRRRQSRVVMNQTPPRF